MDTSQIQDSYKSIASPSDGLFKDNGSRFIARAYPVETEEEVKENFKAGDILVIPETTNGIMEQLRQASGIIVEKEGHNSHAGIVGLSLDIPVILGAVNATNILKSGAVVTVDAEKGIVSSN